MNRLLAIGTLATIALLQFLKLADPGNLLFEVVSIGQTATILQLTFAALLVFIGIREYFSHKYARLAAAISGVSLVTLGILSLFYPLLDAPLKPFDLVFILEAGIILCLAGISVVDESEPLTPLLEQYNTDATEEPSAPKTRKIAYN